MANLIDLSVYKKEDTVIKSINGTEYTIPGNFKSEFFLKLYKTKTQVGKIKDDDFEKAFQLLKEWTLELISLDKSKKVTMETINAEFNDFQVLEMLLSQIMKLTNE